MRWLFLFVLSLNLAYFAWQTTSAPDHSYAEVEPLKNVAPITLLSEQNISKQEVEAASVEVAASKTAVDAAVESNEPDAGLAVTESSSQQPAVTTPVAAAVSEDQQPAGSAGQHAEVLSAADMAAAEKKPAQPAEDPVEQSPPEERCFTLGPFRDLDKLRSLTREIKSYVTAADFRGREEKQPAIYWVYLSPEKSRKEAVATGKRLKSKKIKDFYIIRDGDKVNGISLGHFRSKTGAYGLADKVKKLGFDVNVEPIFKTYTIYWLDYQLAEGVTIPEKIFEKYTTNKDNDKVSRLKRECPG